jgi:hypothetical protein
MRTTKAREGIEPVILGFEPLKIAREQLSHSTRQLKTCNYSAIRFVHSIRADSLNYTELFKNRDRYQ